MSEPRVLVVAPNWLGDAVMSLPALPTFRHAYPASRLIVAARHRLPRSPWCRAWMDRSSPSGADRYETGKRLRPMCGV